MSQSTNDKADQQPTYVLGRVQERNFIGRIPRRTAIAAAPGIAWFVLMMLFNQVKLGVIGTVIFAVITAITHFQDDGRSLVTIVRLRAEKAFRRLTGEDAGLTGPESRVAGGHYRLPGTLATTEMIESTDTHGYDYGIIVNFEERTATVVVSGGLTGGVLLTDEERDRRTAMWGRCEALWAQRPEMLSVVCVSHTRPSTGALAVREVGTLVNEKAHPLAVKLQREKAEVLHNGVQELSWHAAFTISVSMAHRGDYKFVEQLNYSLPSLYNPLAFAGYDQPKPMSAAQITARAHEMCVPDAEGDLEQIAVAGQHHGLGWRDAGPGVTVENGDHYFHDGARSRVWEMVEAPSATFEEGHLEPLVAPHSRVTRKTVVTVYRPYAPGVGKKMSDSEHKDAMVGVNNGKGIRSAEAELRLESTEATRQALARGAKLGRRAMYVMATAVEKEDLTAIEADIEDMGAECQVRFRRMDQMHDAGFQYCLGMGALPFAKDSLNRTT